MKQPPLAVAALALFPGATQRAIIDYCRSTSPSGIANDLDRTANPLLPPGIFGLASPEYAGDEEKAADVLLGMSMAFLKCSKDENFGAQFYAKLLEELFGIRSDYALKLTEDIETVDATTGFGSWLMERIRRMHNWASPDFLGLDVEVSAAKNDLDLGYEFYKLGGVIRDQLLRQSMVMNRVGAAAAGSSNPIVQKLLQAASRVSETPEGGDLAHNAVGDLMRLARPIPLPIGELGAVGAGWESAMNFMNTPTGQQLLGAVLNRAAPPPVQAAAPTNQAPTRPAAPSPGNQPVISIAPVPINAPTAPSSFGQGVWVKTVN